MQQIFDPFGRLSMEVYPCGTRFWPTGQRTPRECQNPVERPDDACSDEHALARVFTRHDALEALVLAVAWKQRPVTQGEVCMTVGPGLHKDVNPRQVGFRLQQLFTEGLLARQSVPNREGKGFPYLWSPTTAVNPDLLVGLSADLIAEATSTQDDDEQVA